MSDGTRQDAARVKLTAVWERTSKAGRRYYAGRLGGAKLLIFELDRKGEDDPALELVLVPSVPRKQGAETAGSDRASQAQGLRESAHPRSAFAAPPRAAADDDCDIPF